MERAVIRVRGCGFPGDRHYHAGYNVWLREEAPGIVTIGATSFGVAIAVEFFAFLPKAPGTRIEADKACALLEIMKTIVPVRTPLAGVIHAVNEAAVADPGLISADPYGAGWLVRLATDDWEKASAQLITGTAIEAAFEEAMRLENFDGVRG